MISSVAVFSTWTTYGTWLPGDQRGWFEKERGLQSADRMREFEALLRMTETAVVLDSEQRNLVEKTIADHCAIRKWLLHSINCRSNHVHVVVSSPDRAIDVPREQFKAWCTRKLRELEKSRGGKREHWWTERGWDVCIDTDDELCELNEYVLEGQ